MYNLKLSRRLDSLNAYFYDTNVYKIYVVMKKDQKYDANEILENVTEIEFAYSAEFYETN